MKKNKGLSFHSFDESNQNTKISNKIYPDEVESPGGNEKMLSLIPTPNHQKFNFLSSSLINIRKNTNFKSIKKFVNDFTQKTITDVKENFSGQHEDESLNSLNNVKFDSFWNKNIFSKALKNVILLNIQIILLFLNILSVINIIYISDYRLGTLGPNYLQPLKISEFIVAGFFASEVLLSILTKKGSLSNKMMQLSNFHNWSNILLIFEIISTNFYSSNFVKINDFFVFVAVFRSLRLSKIRIIGKVIFKKIGKLIKQEKQEKDAVKEQDDIKYWVYNSTIEILVGIFVEATLLMAFNEALDYQGYGNYATGALEFDYITAAYYVIVSMTSIGYGDISPYNWVTRVCTICILFFDISVLSSYIGQLTEHIYKLSPYIRNYYFKNHIVIVGELPPSFMKYFLKELYQCDFLASTVYDDKNLKKFQVSQIIIVGNENPAKELETWLENFSDNYTEIKYLKSNVFENVWHKQANLGFARHLFVFSMNPNENLAQGFESDKKHAYNVQKVVNNFQKLEITLILSTDFMNQIKKDSLWSKINLISGQMMNEYVMANSLENQGLNIWLTHLATLREKSSSLNIRDEFHQLKEYALNMSQEIYPISNF